MSSLLSLRLLKYSLRCKLLKNCCTSSPPADISQSAMGSGKTIKSSIPNLSPCSSGVQWRYLLLCCNLSLCFCPAQAFFVRVLCLTNFLSFQCLSSYFGFLLSEVNDATNAHTEVLPIMKLHSNKMASQQIVNS